MSAEKAPLRSDALSMEPVSFVKGRFLERPNRFLLKCETQSGTVEAYLPNPGRLWELLLPGSILYLAPSPPSRTRKTGHTVLAVERDGAPVFLHTHLANRVAARLIAKGGIPALAGARVLRREVSALNSRFDFLLDANGGELYLEVKSCTLYGNGVAMFPDAVTERGRRHLLELAELSRRGTRAAVLFLVHTPRVGLFLPDYHTDLAFSRALLGVRDDVRILPVSLGWNADLTPASDATPLEIPWKHLEKEISRDSGNVLLLLELGAGTYRKGFFLFLDYADEGLSPLMRRFRYGKNPGRSRLDRLRAAAQGIVALPIRSSRNRTGEISGALAELPRLFPDSLPSLYWSLENPLQDPAFHRVLQKFRMEVRY